MPAKFERCVQDIKDKGEADGVNPWAVCHASTDELKPTEPDKLLTELDDIISGDASFPAADASYKHSGSLMVQKKPETYGNTDAIMDLEEISEACPDLKEIDDMLAKAATFPTSNSPLGSSFAVVCPFTPDPGPPSFAIAQASTICFLIKMLFLSTRVSCNFFF